MPDIERKFAAYAVFSDVKLLLDRLRDQGFPATMAYQDLAKMGVSENNCSRTFQAIQFLNLVSKDGSLTEMGRRLKIASSADYSTILSEMVRSAYGEALQYINPETANNSQLKDAFREYEPSGQRDRMIRLFKGLCVECGMRKLDEITPTEGTTPRRVPTPQKRRTQTQNERKNPEPSHNGVGTHGQYQLIEMLVKQLPPEGQGWTKDRRDLFIKAFEINMDILIPIVNDSKIAVRAKPARPSQKAEEAAEETADEQS